MAELQRRRDAAPPVAAVRRAYREGQEVVISSLDRLGELLVDMETVVLVGSSRTRRHGDWLYALREEPGDISNRFKS